MGLFEFELEETAEERALRIVQALAARKAAKPCPRRKHTITQSDHKRLRGDDGGGQALCAVCHKLLTPTELLDVLSRPGT